MHNTHNTPMSIPLFFPSHLASVAAQVNNITDFNMFLLTVFSCKDIPKVSQEIKKYPKQESY